MMFWIMMFLLLIAGCALLVLPAIKSQQSDVTQSRDALNKVFYQSRLKEIESDEAEGVICDAPAIVAELQQNLLDDIPKPESQNPSTLNRWVLLPGLVLFVVVSVSTYLKVGAHQAVSQWQDVSRQLPALRAKVANEANVPLTIEDVSRFGLALRTELKKNPKNIEDWIVLGRVGFALNDANMAMDAFERAYYMDPANEEARLGYADILTRSTNPADNQKAKQILRSMVKENHSNYRAMSVMAFNAFEQGDYSQAIGAWQTMLNLLPEKDERRTVISMSIERAQALLAEKK